MLTKMEIPRPPTRCIEMLPEIPRSFHILCDQNCYAFRQVTPFPIFRSPDLHSPQPCAHVSKKTDSPFNSPASTAFFETHRVIIHN